MRKPWLSIVLATHNRREILTATLDHLRVLEIPPAEREIIVIDNASTDGTVAAIAGCADVEAIALGRNRGSCAKASGAARARGDVVLFLDDDARPRAGSLERLRRLFASDTRLGAAGFVIQLPGGRQECSALPHVFVGCGVGLRASALRAVGGLDATLFMQAEEYDLTFRLLRAGWRCELFGDLVVDHLKSPAARRSGRTTYLDVRNNLRLIARYLPSGFARPYHDDWLQRYCWLAERHRQALAFQAGRVSGFAWALRERRRYRPWRLTPEVLEKLFCWTKLEQRADELRTCGIRRIVLAEFGKNAYAYFRAARLAGLKVVALADDGYAAAGRTYRGVAVIPLEVALRLDVDAFVISNTSYVHALARQEELVARTTRPVYNWFPPPRSSESSQPPKPHVRNSDARAVCAVLG